MIFFILFLYSRNGSSKQNNSIKFRKPHPNPPQRGGNPSLPPHLRGEDCVIDQEFSFVVHPIYMRKHLTHLIIMSYSLPFGEGWGGVLFSPPRHSPRLFLFNSFQFIKMVAIPIHSRIFLIDLIYLRFLFKQIQYIF
jgi:hypothetical protein